MTCKMMKLKIAQYYIMEKRKHEINFAARACGACVWSSSVRWCTYM